MNKNLKQIISSSKEKLNKCFYKILVDDGGKKFIVEYAEPIKSVSKMLINGWNRFPKEFLNDINKNNPYFDFDNYEYSNELNKIVKKSDQDILRKKLNEILLILQLNKEVLTLLISHIKSILKLFNINFINYQTLNELIDYYNDFINSSSLNINEKTNYLVAMTEYIKNIEDELKKVGIFNSKEFFNENFKYFLILI